MQWVGSGHGTTHQGAIFDVNQLIMLQDFMHTAKSLPKIEISFAFCLLVFGPVQ